MELAAIQVLLDMNAPTFDAIGFHWQIYKPAQSGLTISRLAQFLEAFLTTGQNDLFKEIFSPSMAKLEAAVNHQLGFFAYNLTQAVRH